MLDLAYGTVRGPGGAVDVLPMLEDIDCAERRGVARPGLGAVVRRATEREAVLVPTVWGDVRTAALVGEFAAIGAVVRPIPRAVAIAASHADATVNRCAVVETCLLPATGGHWSVHAVSRVDGRWLLGRGAVTQPRRIPVDPSWAALLEDADAVFVDGPDHDSIRRAQRCIAESFGVRTVAVDRAVLERHGGRTGLATGADLLAGLSRPPQSRARRTARAPGVVAAVLLIAVAVAAGWMHWPRAAPPDRQTVQVGRAELSVPGRWHRSDLTDSGSGTRAVFAAPDDGRRLIVVVSRLRTGSTSATVAESLRNRIGQRGDDVVAGFAADLSYAGRRVIGYRETPASGAPIAWYVTVDAGSQVSVGCQGGTGEDSVEDACRAAVGSVRVG
ncbi:hypothetical protein SCNU_02902 [Gordonia neofelifaecis NRRL B-59395]|uniref:Type VII secretion-associated protein n=1 Tax=Gordonia neofelifaecis NRRL B-59395 TaxID=644548 RepID=F1YFH7_9ACTN|nr:hypothetical protein SCNU_02902 [Gordonia neofelifaecis NRRL B-59395]